MKVSELIETLSKYDRDDDVTFYFLNNDQVIMSKLSLLLKTQVK